MNIQTIRRILALQSTVLLLVVVPFLATGAESTSFQLYTNFDEADQTPLTSGNYSLDEGGGTWTALPLAGSNFQIVTAPPAAVSSSSSSSASSVVNGGGGGGGTDSGGGRRPRPSSTSSASSSETSQSQATRSSEPTASSSESSEKDDVPLDAGIVPGSIDDTIRPSAGREPAEPEGALTEGTDPETGKVCLCNCPKTEVTRCAAGTFEERLVRIPVLIPTAFQSPMPSMLLLIIAFMLGYFTKATRSGQMQVSSGKTSKTKKKK